MKQVYKINAEGFYVEPILIPNYFELVNPSLDELEDLPEDYTMPEPYVFPEDCIQVPPPNGLYKPKWNGEEWLEGKTDDEFELDSLFNQLKPNEAELAESEFEIKVLTLLMEMGVI